jgi:hypothetical protein
LRLASIARFGYTLAHFRSLADGSWMTKYADGSCWAESRRPTLAALPDQSGIHCQQVIGQLPTFLVVMCS